MLILIEEPKAATWSDGFHSFSPLLKVQIIDQCVKSGLGKFSSGYRLPTWVRLKLVETCSLDKVLLVKWEAT